MITMINILGRKTQFEIWKAEKIQMKKKKKIAGLRRSPEQVKECLKIRKMYEEGNTVIEIAKILGITRQRIYVQLHAASANVTSRMEMHQADYNPQRFHEINEETAYFVGALFTRGRFKKSNTRLIYEKNAKDCGQFDQFQDWIGMSEDPNRRSFLIRYTRNTKNDLRDIWGLDPRKRGPAHWLRDHRLCKFFCRGMWDHGVAFILLGGKPAARLSAPNRSIKVFQKFVEPRLGKKLTVGSSGLLRMSVSVLSDTVPSVAKILYSKGKSATHFPRIEDIYQQSITGEST